MLLTTEVRWFQAGKLPRSLTDWFASEHLGAVPIAQERRTDCYLRLLHDTFLGVKFRQGSLEVKWRQAVLGQARAGDRWAGQLERWIKWSHTDAASLDHPQLQAYLQSESWIEVTKARSQRIYQVENNQVSPTEPQKRVSQACSLELTQLEAAHQAWWTVGLEASGSSQQSLAALQLTLSWLSASTQNLPQLELSASYAYPHWLARL
ncbi:MAG: hypothetical protein F6K04_10565 [Leptolyngbya sp. SIO4C5]|nr:hypothetical protein [Leptolyngbya sp. SIO4C5]